MIEREETVEIGKFQRTHGLKGELNALIEVCPEYVEDGNPLVLEIEGILVPFYAESVRPKGQLSYLVKLDGIDTQEEAAAFVNCAILAERELLTEYVDEEELMLSEELAGFQVVDITHGELGEVERIDDSTENVLLIVRRGDEEIMIPFVDTFIEEINPQERVIRVSLPEGLMEL